MAKEKTTPEIVLVLKSVKSNMASGHTDDFIYPQSGHVEAKDFKPTKECGSGLHGWLWGVGDYSLKVKSIDAKWLVIEVEKSQIIELDGKVKFQSGNVIFCGDFQKAFRFVMDAYSKIMVFENSASGDYGHASASGDSGHASASGDYGHASASGNYGHASASGDSGHASASGYYGHASASGNYGHASASGNYGIGCVLGTNGKAKCGEDGSVILTYYDGKRYRHAIGYAGENGIKKDTWYEVIDGKLKEVKS